MSMVRAQGLTRYYGSRCALDQVSFEIEAGRIVGILGLNGAGKSTLLRILAGLLRPSAGKAEVEGVDVLDAPAAARKRIGFLPEDPPLYQEMTVVDFLRYAAQLKGATREEVEDRLAGVMDMSGLEKSDGERVIGELSHGYRKRVGIAQAILHRPALVILDEPISGLDPRQIVEMRDTIAALRGEHTVLVSSHILPEISQTCDRILLIHEGRLVAEGEEDALTSRLSGGPRVRVRVSAEAAKVQPVLDGAASVSGSELRAVDGGVDAVVTLEAADAIEALVRALVEAGLGVREVQPLKNELETIFLDLTRSEEAAA